MPAAYLIERPLGDIGVKLTLCTLPRKVQRKRKPGLPVAILSGFWVVDGGKKPPINWMWRPAASSVG